MRESCLDCARKHLGQACIVSVEAKLGYPEHKWLAIAHLAEAEAELINVYHHMAIAIRIHRKAYETDSEYQIPIIRLIKELTELDEEV